MAPVSVTLNDLKCHFRCLQPFKISYLQKYST